MKNGKLPFNKDYYAILLDVLNPDDENSRLTGLLNELPDEYKLTFTAGIDALLSQVNNDKEVERFVKIFQLFFRRLSTLAIYFDSNGEGYKKRKSELHKITGEPRIQLEHLFLAGRIGHETFFEYCETGQKEETKIALNNVLAILGEANTSSILLLAAFFHDIKEDFFSWMKKTFKNGYSEEDSEALTDAATTNIIKSALKKFGFEDLEKFIVPIVRILTHKKEISSEEYLEEIDSPKEEVFEEYSLSEEEKKAIQTLARHIKIMGDQAQNFKSKQPINALKNKLPVYISYIFENYPDFFKIHKHRLHPSVKFIFEELEKDTTIKTAEEIQKKVAEIIAPLIAAEEAPNKD